MYIHQLKRNICSGMVILSIMVFALCPSRTFGATTSSRSLGRFSGVTNFVASHPRLTAAVGIGAAVVGACLFYRWWQTRNLLLLKARALFVTKLPNGNLVIGESDSNISVWDSQKRICLKRIRVAETIPGEYLQIVVLSNDEIALFCRITGKVALIHLNAQENKAVYQELGKPIDIRSQDKEVILWIAKIRENQLICKTNKEHFYQLNKHGDLAWTELTDRVPVEMPADALGKCDYSQVQLSGDGKIARVVNNDWLYNGSVVIE